MELKLKARQRSETGKSAARKMRNEGEVPAVMYGHGIDPRPLTVKKEELGELIHGRAGTNVLIDLQVLDGKDKTDHLVMIKELQRHPFKEKLLHVDFLKVARDEKVIMKVPISINGEEDSVGLKAGGTLQHNLWEVELECLPTEVPDHIFADISQVQVGEHLVIGDLKLPAGVDIVADVEDVILTILAPRLAVEGALTEEEVAQAKEEAAAAEAAASPESGGEE